MVRLSKYDIIIQRKQISQLTWIIWLEQYAFVWAEPHSPATENYKLLQCFLAHMCCKVAALFFSFLFFRSMDFDPDLVFSMTDTYSWFKQEKINKETSIKKQGKEKEKGFYF